MRGGGGRPRPLSHHGASTQLRANIPPARKIFNCIVDDTALVVGVKKSTRNGIRQWVSHGQIRLFVPLHALEQLSQQKGAQSRHGEDVRETLRWLDDATSRQSNPIALQGAEDHFESWAEVEKFAVPRTLFSEQDSLDVEPEAEIEDIPDQGTNGLSLSDAVHKSPASSAASAGTRSESPSSIRSQRSSISALSPPTSPVKPSPLHDKSESITVGANSSSSGTVPAPMQPLFNYILWRIHQEENPVAALESFIFLCNDENKVNHAKGFEIRTKRLEQLRDAISREDREYKNSKAAAAARDNQNPNGNMSGTVGRSPPVAPAAMIPSSPSHQKIMDPDAFDRRDSALVSQNPDERLTPRSPQASNTLPAQGRNSRHLPFAPRGGARGNNHRGGPRGRGNFGGSPRGGFVPQPRPDGALMQSQIDPNSFVRPRGNGFPGRGGRKLWVPT